MTREEIEWFASEARRGAKLDLKSIEIYPADLAELCRIAAEGQACDAVIDGGLERMKQ